MGVKDENTVAVSKVGFGKDLSGRGLARPVVP